MYNSGSYNKDISWIPHSCWSCPYFSLILLILEMTKENKSAGEMWSVEYPKVGSGNMCPLDEEREMNSVKLLFI